MSFQDDPERRGADTAPAEMKKPTLIDLVVAKSGKKKRDAKPVVEATLAVLGQALSEGRPLDLQPLGKLRVTRTKPLKNGQMLVTRVRRSSWALAEGEGLEPPAKDG